MFAFAVESDHLRGKVERAGLVRRANVRSGSGSYGSGSLRAAASGRAAYEGDREAGEGQR